MNTNLVDKWNEYINTQRPSATELYEVVRKQYDLFFKKEELTEEYIELQHLYKWLFGLYLCDRSKITEVEVSMLERGHLPVEKKSMTFFQKYDMMGLHFLYLRSWAHVERLTMEEGQVLKKCLQKQIDEEALQDAFRIVEATYPKVLTIHPEKQGQWFELYPDVHGRGRVQGENIVFAIRTTPEYNEAGMFVDREHELEKKAEIKSVRKQLEPILTEVLGVKVLVLEEE